MFPNNSPRPRPSRTIGRGARRRAATMAAVLVCLLVVVLISGTLVRGIVFSHRQAGTESRQLQALWLAESAAALASQELRADADYLGQTWRATIDAAAGSTGLAEIRVERVDQQPRQRIVYIKTTYPDDPIQRNVLEHEITVTLPALGASE